MNRFYAVRSRSWQQWPLSRAGGIRPDAVFCPGGTIENSPAIHRWETEGNPAKSRGTAVSLTLRPSRLQPSLTGLDVASRPFPSDESLGYFHSDPLGRSTLIDINGNHSCIMRPNYPAHLSHIHPPKIHRSLIMSGQPLLALVT